MRSMDFNTVEPGCFRSIAAAANEAATCSIIPAVIACAGMPRSHPGIVDADHGADPSTGAAWLPPW